MTTPPPGRREPAVSRAPALLLRVDVDADRHLAVEGPRNGLPNGGHRRTAVGGLDHELNALAAAQAKQRRRAEHGRIWEIEPRPQFARRRHRPRRVTARANDPDQLAEGRIAE